MGKEKMQMCIYAERAENTKLKKWRNGGKTAYYVIFVYVFCKFGQKIIDETEDIS